MEDTVETSTIDDFYPHTQMESLALLSGYWSPSAAILLQKFELRSISFFFFDHKPKHFRTAMSHKLCKLLVYQSKRFLSFRVRLLSGLVPLLLDLRGLCSLTSGNQKDRPPGQNLRCSLKVATLKLLPQFRHFSLTCNIHSGPSQRENCLLFWFIERL